MHHVEWAMQKPDAQGKQLRTKRGSETYDNDKREFRNCVYSFSRPGMEALVGLRLLFLQDAMHRDYLLQNLELLSLEHRGSIEQDEAYRLPDS